MSKFGVIDVEIYDKRVDGKVGGYAGIPLEDGCWEQGTFLVHGYDDVLWTDNAEEASRYVLESIKKMAEDIL